MIALRSRWVAPILLVIAFSVDLLIEVGLEHLMNERRPRPDHVRTGYSFYQVCPHWALA
jgi:hypothetical protein